MYKLQCMYSLICTYRLHRHICKHLDLHFKSFKSTLNKLQSAECIRFGKFLKYEEREIKNKKWPSTILTKNEQPRVNNLPNSFTTTKRAIAVTTVVTQHVLSNALCLWHTCWQLQKVPSCLLRAVLGRTQGCEFSRCTKRRHVNTCGLTRTTALGIYLEIYVPVSHREDCKMSEIIGPCSWRSLWPSIICYRTKYQC